MLILVALQSCHTLRGCVDWNNSDELAQDLERCHTLRGCVDWNLKSAIRFQKKRVTPFVGVWIETSKRKGGEHAPTSHTLRGCVDWNLSNIGYQIEYLKSHPSWVCGLKLPRTVLPAHGLWVTPFVGVWIETSVQSAPDVGSTVTPFVGVWIETCDREEERHQHQVTPFVGVWIETYGEQIRNRFGFVTPFVGVWIETDGRLRLALYFRSHPSWVCGLKLVWIYQSVSIYKSHPSWVCGLKPSEGSYTWLLWSVTPFVGVWIETLGRKIYDGRRYVTPFVGVWNETENRFYFLSPLEKVIFTKTCHWLSISYNDKKYDSGLL